MGGQYELNYRQVEQLQERMKKVPRRAESTVNEILHSKGSKAMIQSVIAFMPVSRVEDKQHAKESNPLRADKFNLGFRVYAKGGAANRRGSFGYLVFPDEGRGSSNPWAQHFFQRGAERTNDYIFDEVMNALKRELENLGGN